MYFLNHLQSVQKTAIGVTRMPTAATLRGVTRAAVVVVIKAMETTVQV